MDLSYHSSYSGTTIDDWIDKTRDGHRQRTLSTAGTVSDKAQDDVLIILLGFKNGDIF